MQLPPPALHVSRISQPTVSFPSRPRVLHLPIYLSRMVTGVETAGLLLGAFPLIISALEHYEHSIDPARAFVKWQDELLKTVRELYMGLTTYNQTVCLLLKPIASEQDLVEMMEDPKSSLWKDETLADKLCLMLGPTYDAFMLTIQDIDDIMASIAKCLNIEGAQKVSRTSLSV